ncbi:sensor histidine kinase [Paenibacillus sp. TRM 82003]|nr:sensor histidine kinase [Paenibacillus sp. TRM 82003]
MKEFIKVHWVTAFIVAIRTMWFFFGIYDIYQHPERFSHHQTILLTAGMVWLAVFWYTAAFVLPLVAFLRKGNPQVLTLLLEFAISGSLFLFLSQDWAAGMAFYNFPVFIIGYLSGIRSALVSAPVSILLLPIASGLLWNHSLAVIADRWVDLLFVFAIGFCFNKLLMTLLKSKEMMGIIQQQNQTLELKAKQIEKLTLSEERNRLSRELHDTVGHTFTAVITAMDAVHYLMDDSPEEAKKNLYELRQLTRHGLDEIRKHIHQIAPDEEEQSLSDTLRQISNQFAEHTSVRVSFVTEGEERRLSESIRITLIRMLQEAFTNAVRHGHASEIQVRLRFGGEEVALRVEDNGVGMETLAKGFGMNAMTERLTNLHGDLYITSSPHQGTAVEGKIPIRPVGPIESHFRL